MRHLISGIVAAVAVMAAAPAMACGYSPCAQPVYVAPEPVYSGCSPCGGWAHERLPDPVQQYSYPAQQYYYVEQGPTYTGPGNWAPARTYQEGGVYSRPYYYGHRHHHAYRPWYPRASYHHAARHQYGYASPAPYYRGHRVLRRYY